MDNHAHFVMRASSAENLGYFMRSVNSQLARIINKYFERDSQALRERYKSPLISTTHYLISAMKYVLMNRYQVNRNLRPEKDPFCSAYWRIHKPYKIILNPESERDIENNQLATLLDSYKKLDIGVDCDDSAFTIRLIDQAIHDDSTAEFDVFKNGHTIGDAATVLFRGELLSAFKRSQGPPVYC